MLTRWVNKLCRNEAYNEQRSGANVEEQVEEREGVSPEARNSTRRTSILNRVVYWISTTNSVRAFTAASSNFSLQNNQKYTFGYFNSLPFLSTLFSFSTLTIFFHYFIKILFFKKFVYYFSNF
jgi:hypothetical protein